MHSTRNSPPWQRQGKGRGPSVARLLPAAIVMLAGLLAAPSAAAASKTLLLYGDSLMAGYGLAPADAFQAKLQAALDKQGLDVEIVNASVSGDTTADGLERFDWSVPKMPDAALLGLGANDMLRGLPPRKAEANLAALLDRFKAADVPVLLAGMMAAPSLGSDYVAAFDGMYPKLARNYSASLIPFFLEGVALDPALNQADRIHPNARGVDRIVGSITPYVVKLLNQSR